MTYYIICTKRLSHVHICTMLVPCIHINDFIRTERLRHVHIFTMLVLCIHHTTSTYVHNVYIYIYIRIINTHTSHDKNCIWCKDISWMMCHIWYIWYIYIICALQYMYVWRTYIIYIYLKIINTHTSHDSNCIWCKIYHQWCVSYHLYDIYMIYVRVTRIYHIYLHKNNKHSYISRQKLYIRYIIIYTYIQKIYTKKNTKKYIYTKKNT